jgi:hypothetical protein
MHNFFKSLVVFSFVILGCKANNSGAIKKTVIVRLPPKATVIAAYETSVATGSQYDLQKPDHK